MDEFFVFVLSLNTPHKSMFVLFHIASSNLSVNPFNIPTSKADPTIGNRDMTMKKSLIFFDIQIDIKAWINIDKDNQYKK